MTADELAAIAAAVSAAVAIIATAAAIRQTFLARRSAKAAERALSYSGDQAASARESADSARRAARAATVQANSAIEQVEIMKLELAAAASDRKVRDQPDFTLEVERSEVGALRSLPGGRQEFLPLAGGGDSVMSDWKRRHHVAFTLTAGRGPFLVNILEVLMPGGSEAPAVQLFAESFRMTIGAKEVFQVVAPYQSTESNFEASVQFEEAQENGRKWTLGRAFRS